MTALPQFVHDLLRSPPHRSEGLNIWFFRAARLLWPYREEGEIVNLLKAATYGESVRSGEIERAVKRSKSCAWQPGQPNHIRDSPKWPALSVQQRLAIIRDGGGLVDLWEASPVRIDDNESHTETLIDALFPADLLLCCGKDNSHFDTRSREEWRGQLSALQLIVPSPMTARSGLTQDGKQSPHALSITGQRRFLVVDSTMAMSMTMRRCSCIWPRPRPWRSWSTAAQNLFTAGFHAKSKLKSNYTGLCHARSR